MPRVLVFDLDDTLYPEREYAHSGLRHVGRHLEREHGVESAGERLVAILERGVRGRVFDELLEEEGMDPELIPRLVRLYRSHRPAISLFPGIDELLRSLPEEDGLALLTDGPAVCQRRKVEALGLRERFGYVVITDEEGPEAWKPSPWGYRRIMARFSAAGADCVYVGDNPEKDFVTARRLGWHTVRLKHPLALNPRSPPTPEHEAAVVTDDPGALRQILAPGG